MHIFGSYRIVKTNPENEATKLNFILGTHALCSEEKSEHI